MVDAELDVFEVRFNPDQISPFKIRADGVTHISIDTCQLQRICGLKFDADELWAMLEPHWSDEVGGVAKLEHLSVGDHPNNASEQNKDGTRMCGMACCRRFCGCAECGLSL